MKDVRVVMVCTKMLQSCLVCKVKVYGGSNGRMIILFKWSKNTCVYHVGILERSLGFTKDI